MPPIRLALLLGSNRSPRFCDTVAAWAHAEAARHGGYRVDVVDPRTLGLPAALPPAPDLPTLRLRRRLAAADAFLVVTPEYNHGYPAPLKQTVDAAQAEWQAKPVAFVGYGGHSGGLRAVEQLRQVFCALHAVPVHDSLLFPGAAARFDAAGRPPDADACGRAMQAMLAQLHWWSAALRQARAERPYRANAA
ncbi:NAD(P)H-dependent oxidoreductase [Luteimonas sp. Y-2-2-4F]|nr:NAD(P)H-dependent oxidoreductase [Luteimonas sp. Y-2-2-4F]MCD9031416.1 NAD(P)H-dependent oxidoreductase [Luteimonas sp. Y-2-2-4F]